MIRGLVGESGLKRTTHTNTQTRTPVNSGLSDSRCGRAPLDVNSDLA